MPVAAAKKTAKKRRTAIVTKKKPLSKHEVEEQAATSSSNSSSDSSDEEVNPPTKRNKTAGIKDTSHDLLVDSDSDVGTKKTPTRRRGMRSLAAARSGASHALADSDEEAKSPHTRSSPDRQSALKASLRLKKYKDAEIDSDDDLTLPKKRRTKKKKPDSDDEQYTDPGEDEGDSDEADDLDTDSDDSNTDDGTDDDDEEAESDDEKVHRKTVGRVRDDEIGTDESSGDESDKNLSKPVYQSPRLSFTITIEPKQKSQGQHEDTLSSSSSSSSSSSDDDSSSVAASARRTVRQSMSPPKLPACQSTEDAITAEPLPALHVCYFAPDAKSCHCFSLETLRKIALSTNQPVITSKGKRTFLQPPHFRSIISDDLVDQIASRFGRDALDVDGPYYRRKDDVADRYGSETIDESFLDAFNEYIRSTMGSRDLYCCPLCYTVAYNKVKLTGNNKKKAKKNLPIDEAYSTDFTIDPMSILNALDGQQLQLASAFCFRSAAQTKKHLREEHGIDTKVVRGNYLYERFQIRKQDGLLQRYIGQRCKKGTPLFGYILGYWHQDGNNLDFMLLLHLVDRAEHYRNADTSNEEIQAEAEDYFEPAVDFFESFHEDTNDLWELLSGPYRNMDDLGEFMADDDEEVPDGPSARSIYREMELMKQQEELDDNAEKAARYEELDRAPEEDDEPSEEEGGGNHNDAFMDRSDEDNEYGEEEDDSDDVIVLEDSDEESVDSWTKEKNKKMEKTLRKRRSKEFRRNSRTSRASLTPEAKKPSSVSVSKRKRLSILDSDDEE